MSVKVTNKFKSLRNKMISGSRHGIDDSADIIVAEGYASAPVKTGALRNSIHKEKVDDNTMRVEASVEPFNYAYWRHEISSRPHYLSEPLEENKKRILDTVVEDIRTSLLKL